VDVVTRSDSALLSAVLRQPVAVAVEADQHVFQFYASGVLTGLCAARVNHAVLLVGFGSQGSVDYWTVKNSWGAGWGEAGYVRLARGAAYNAGAGQCGIYTRPTYPNAA
jgi:C1A family cysteine protease